MVFAADSASTLEARRPNGESIVVNVYRHGDKIFNLYKGLPIVAMTCGMGHIGDRAISSLAKDLRQRLVGGGKGWQVNPRHYTIEEVAQKAQKFLFDERYQQVAPPPAQPHLFEFWIGGYSSGSELHDVRKLTISNGACTLEQLGPEGNCGIRWGGQPEAITRLVKGFSPGLKEALIANGMSDPDATKIDGFAKTQFEVNLAQPSMPIQDAIDLAEFLVETTKGFFRFKLGADTVGGDTDVAVVTRHEGFKWIRRKHYYSPHLNPLETDHVGHSKGR
ncbi:hypothetical protein NKI78_27045 [Mesorhizobium sp. M0400]|uniref:hypothetical protein n=1 Tax=Mesorhizobium sp. M0400 TaxID=2956941 RepID=UPI003336F504